MIPLRDKYWVNEWVLNSSDANAGTFKSPFKTIAHASCVAELDDIIFVVPKPKIIKKEK